MQLDLHLRCLRLGLMPAVAALKFLKLWMQ